MKQWLTDFGIPGDRVTHSDNQGWIAFDATTEDAGDLLHAVYHLYEHFSTGHMTTGCDRYEQSLGS
jgi:tripeptidyl-peptidase-1